MLALHVATRISDADLAKGAAAEPGTSLPLVSFRISGGASGGEASWEIKALRNDRFVQQRGAPVELDRPDNEKGTYQQPELYGRPREKTATYRPEPAERNE